MRAYKDVKPGSKEHKAGDSPLVLEICPGHSLSVVDGLVCVDGKATTKFFKQAEKVEECNVSDQTWPVPCSPFCPFSIAYAHALG